MLQVYVEVLQVYIEMLLLPLGAGDREFTLRFCRFTLRCCRFMLRCCCCLQDGNRGQKVYIEVLQVYIEVLLLSSGWERGTEFTLRCCMFTLRCCC